MRRRSGLLPDNVNVIQGESEREDDGRARVSGRHRRVETAHASIGGGESERGTKTAPAGWHDLGFEGLLEERFSPSLSFSLSYSQLSERQVSGQKPIYLRVGETL